MIDSAADYDFVTGITNGEVLIDGHIMPWRDYNYLEGYSPGTDKPECLRGEDLCFLREGIFRRLAIGAYGTQTTWAYDRRVRGLTIANEIHSRMQGMYTPQYTNPSFFTTTSFSDKTITRPSSPGYSYHPSEGYSEYLFTNAMMVSQRTDFYQYGVRKPPSGDNIRKLFYDFGMAKCQTYEPTYVNDGLSKDFQQTGQYEAGDSSAEWGTVGMYPQIPTSSFRNSTLLFGEHYTGWKNGTKLFARARSFTRTAPATFTFDWNQSYFNFSDYASCTFALVFFWTYGEYGGYYTNSIYDTQNIKARWTTVPATLDNSTVKVSLQSLLTAGWSYARECGVASQMFSQGRGMVTYDNASYSGTSIGIDVECAVHPVFVMKDLDYSYWNWTP